MAVRLVRETSDIPNISNKDDTIMTRYAYGADNGVVKAYGQECGYTINNSNLFTILDGRIVIDGWEIDIDGAGWTLDVSQAYDTQYYSIYAEINVATEQAQIKATYSRYAYPVVDKGDDLTQTLNGVARLLLYRIKATESIISLGSVEKHFNLLEYYGEKVRNVFLNGKLNDLVIQRKQILWEGELTDTSSSKAEKLSNINLQEGDIIEVVWATDSNPTSGFAGIHNTQLQLARNNTFRQQAFKTLVKNSTFYEELLVAEYSATAKELTFMGCKAISPTSAIFTAVATIKTVYKLIN